jgi:hypothetical protein
MRLSKDGMTGVHVGVQNYQHQKVWATALLFKRLNNKKGRRRKTKNDKDDGYMCLRPRIEDLPARECRKKDFHSQEMAVLGITSDQCHEMEGIE